LRRVRISRCTGFNGGMSLEALMAVLGHVTPEMTLRYASDTIRAAYDIAIAKTRHRTRLVAGPGGQFVPDRIDWLHSEIIKTRVVHGYCSRHLAAGPYPYSNICEQCDNLAPGHEFAPALAAGPCPYSNICEQCDNLAPGHEFAPALADQLADITVLRDDADQRGLDRRGRPPRPRHHQPRTKPPAPPTATPLTTTRLDATPRAG
jgi:hypothetical protein